MNNQEKAFLTMSYKELNINNEDRACAIMMFLKYSPDALNRLFDRCVIKCCSGQVQGKVYLDFFLFNPQSKVIKALISFNGAFNYSIQDPFATELNIINTLVASGKERFLIHPIFEIFLKLKWFKGWTYYLVYIALYFMFLAALVGYTLAHFGNLYDGQERWEYLGDGGRNVWWYFLAAMHGYIILTHLSKVAQMGGYLK